MYPVIDMQASGKRIKDIMKKNNISAKQLQNYLGLSCVQSVYHWFNGMSMPTIDNLYAMSELFQISIDEMICGTRKHFILKEQDAQCRRMAEYYNRLQKRNAA